MTTLQRQFKLRGRIALEDTRHQIVEALGASNAPDNHYIAPTTVNVNIVCPESKIIGVPQYSTTVYGGVGDRYDPAGDCNGNFMSYKFQPNNNCYAYGTNIATNSFPQPGRKSGYLLTRDDFKKPFNDIGELVKSYAIKDGLVYVGTTMDEIMKYKSDNSNGVLEGHFVGLLISPASNLDWEGDYHWARCDNSSDSCDSWSQKDGGDQVTNFDFAGNPITDPATANWTVNEGPVFLEGKQGQTTKDTVFEYSLYCRGADVLATSVKQVEMKKEDMVVEYAFYCYMFVPNKGVDII